MIKVLCIDLQMRQRSPTTTFDFLLIWGSSSHILPFLIHPYANNLPRIASLTSRNDKSNHAGVRTGFCFANCSQHAETRQRWYWIWCWILDALHAACVFLSLYYFLAGVGATSAQIRTDDYNDDYNAFSLCVASIVHFFNRHTKLTMILSLFSSTIYSLHRNCVLVPQASSMIRCSISAISSTRFIHEAISIIDIKSFKMLLSVSNFGRKSRGEYIQCPTPCHLFWLASDGCPTPCRSFVLIG